MAKRNVAHSHKGYKPAFNDATMQRMEAGAVSKVRGQQRRLVLLACTRDSATWVQMAKEQPEAFEEVAEMIIEYQKHAKAIHDVATTAFVRIAMAYEMSQAA